MYQGKKKKPVMPAEMQAVQQRAPLGASPVDNTPSMAEQLQAQAMSSVGGRVIDKGIDKGMAKAAPLMDKGMSAISNMLSPAAGTMGGAAGIPGASKAATAAMGAGVDAGIANAMTGAAGTATAGAGTAAAGGAMAGLGAAMPMIGAGLLGAKLFGLFSEGGLVGPLAGIKYKSDGGEVRDEFAVNFVSPLASRS